MDVLVTGGGGFIGSHTVRALLREGRGVRVLDNFSTGHPSRLGEFRGRLDVVQGDIRDRDTVRLAMNGVKHVIHLAATACVNTSVVDPHLCHTVNMMGTLEVLVEARDAGVEGVVLASSCSIYGDQAQLPVEEGSPSQPSSPYALSKRTNEEQARLFYELYGLPTCVLRYFNVYGPGQSADSAYAAVIPKFIAAVQRGDPIRIFGDGGQTRDFVFVEDVVRANVAALGGSSRRLGNVYNVGGGESISISELASQVCTKMQGPSNLEYLEAKPGEVRHSRADISRAGRHLQWTPSVTLDEGLDRTIESFGNKE